jgi:hypothetical protein
LNRIDSSAIERKSRLEGLAVTSTVPIVFANVTDPVAAGFGDGLARPGGNTTGFTLFEYGISAKWLELIKEIAPGPLSKRAASCSLCLCSLQWLRY